MYSLHNNVGSPHGLIHHSPLDKQKADQFPNQIEKMKAAGRDVMFESPQTYAEALKQKSGKKCLGHPFYRDFFTGNYGENTSNPTSRLKHQDKEI